MVDQDVLRWLLATTRKLDRIVSTYCREKQVLFLESLAPELPGGNGRLAVSEPRRVLLLDPLLPGPTCLSAEVMTAMEFNWNVLAVPFVPGATSSAMWTSQACPSPSPPTAPTGPCSSIQVPAQPQDFSQVQVPERTAEWPLVVQVPPASHDRVEQMAGQGSVKPEPNS